MSKTVPVKPTCIHLKEPTGKAGKNSKARRNEPKLEIVYRRGE